MRTLISGPYRPAVSAGGFVYVSGTMARDASGAIAGDVRAQTRQVLEQIGGVLAEHGVSIDRVVSVTVYLRSAADFQAMNETYLTFWPKQPPTRTTVVAALVQPDALVEMSAVAVAAGGERQIVHPPHWMTSPNPYSYAIRSGDTVFVSGLVSRRGRDNSVVDGDVATQTRVVLDNAGELLTASGLDFSNVVSTRVFLPDRSTFAQMNAAYAAYFPSTPPARTTISAGLAGAQHVVEISLMAFTARPAGADDGRRTGPRLPFSPAVRAGSRLHVSGTLGCTESNTRDAAAQTRETLARISRTLTSAGYAPTDVVDVTVFLSDTQVYGDMNGAYAAFFRGSFPARTAVGAELVAPGFVEIAMTAVRA
jgi:enamine deaminase RidA (YjgF/YER057c/UK114 family)